MSDLSYSEIIVESAQKLFYARGVHAVGMDEISVAAGTSLKRLYKTFASKDAIVFAVITRWHEGWSAAIDSATARVGDPRDRLLAVYDFFGAWFRSDGFRGCAFINTFGELGGMSADIAALTRNHKQSFQDQMARLVAEAGAPSYLGPQLSILVEGALTTAAIAGNPDAAGQARSAAEVLIDAAMSTAPNRASCTGPGWSGCAVVDSAPAEALLR